MRKLNLIFQETLKILFSFLLFYIWLRYFIRKFWLAFLLSFLCALVVYFVLFFIKRKKTSKTGLKLKEKLDAENSFLSLALNDKAMDFFFKLASKKHKNITKHKHHLLITHEAENVKTLLWFENSFEGLSVSKTMEIYQKVKKEKASKIVICCKNISDKHLLPFLENFNEKFLILDEYQTYEKLYKFYDCFPEQTHKYKTEKKLVFKDFLAFSFNKARAKSYLLSACVLLLSSLFIRMSIYYCIMASVLVVFAIVSYFNPYFNIKNQSEVL
ncbi:MAG: hypothetical protein E7375_01895 [Clostridiales bacterium]|nr:hypothetical protein [Clostridiales bacterium]